MTMPIRPTILALALALASVPAAAQRRDTAAAEPPRPAPRASWTSDGRTFQPGDGLTVLLDEYTLAAADRVNSARSSRSSDMDLAVSQSVMTGGTLPTSGGAGINSGRSVESSENGQSGAHNRFQGEITVRVVGVDGARLRVEGKKRVQIGRGWQEVALTGWVSPRDVDSGNLVQSRRVGDLQLTYTSRGGPRQGLVSRIVGIVWP